MGILRGDVDILGLGNLLQLLAMNKREGVLTLSRGTARKTLHFGPQGMRLLSSSMRRINKVGRILLRRRRIKAGDLEQLLREQKLLGWKLGQTAVASGLVKKRDVEEALREQVEEEIFDMFMWDGAGFEFVEGARTPHPLDGPLASLTVEAHVTALVLEAARRADELLLIRRTLNDDEMVLRTTGAPLNPEALGGIYEAAVSIFRLIDGERTLRQIVAASICPRFMTMQAVYRLFTGGFVGGQDRRGNPVRVARPAGAAR